MPRRSAPRAALAGGPLLVAHRGGGGLKPENTLAAFLEADSVWRADMCELDVRATSDGHCVVIHDATVDRTTNGTGAVAAMTLAEIQSLDAGYRFSTDGGRSFPWRDQGFRVPTIEEVFAALPAMRFTVEVKIASAQVPLFKAIAEYQATERAIAAGERNAYRTLFHAYRGPISASLEQSLPFYFMHRMRMAALSWMRADVVQMPEHYRGRRMLTARLVQDLHARGILVHVWTVNAIDDMHRLLDWGVDGLITDFPDRLARVLHERTGRPLPPGLL
ncbi:MAG TPA: glycerophosphodiester phosphodiesterase [Longimicrobiales bacterium]